MNAIRCFIAVDTEFKPQRCNACMSNRMSRVYSNIDTEYFCSIETNAAYTKRKRNQAIEAEAKFDSSAWYKLSLTLAKLVSRVRSKHCLGQTSPSPQWKCFYPPTKIMTCIHVCYLLH